MDRRDGHADTALNQVELNEHFLTPTTMSRLVSSFREATRLARSSPAAHRAISTARVIAPRIRTIPLAAPPTLACSCRRFSTSPLRPSDISTAQYEIGSVLSSEVAVKTRQLTARDDSTASSMCRRTRPSRTGRWTA